MYGKGLLQLDKAGIILQTLIWIYSLHPLLMNYNSGLEKQLFSDAIWVQNAWQANKRIFMSSYFQSNTGVKLWVKVGSDRKTIDWLGWKDPPYMI